MWSKLCAADSTEATEVKPTMLWSCKHSVIPSEDTQNILYFQCLLLRLKPLLAIFLEDKRVEDVSLAHLSLKAAAHTLHSGETWKHIFIGSKCSFMYKRNLQENVIFSLGSLSDSEKDKSLKFCESNSISFLQMREWERQKVHLTL